MKLTPEAREYLRTSAFVAVCIIAILSIWLATIIGAYYCPWLTFALWVCVATTPWLRGLYKAQKTHTAPGARDK